MMFKETAFLSFFLSASLVSAVPSQIVKRTTPVKADYEDIAFSGIPLVTEDEPIPNPYKQLNYAGFIAVQENPLEDPLVHPNGLQAVISQNFSSISAQYTGSPVSAFVPSSAYFGCFFSDDTAVAPAISCVVEVIAYQPDGTQYTDTKACAYGGIGALAQCTFPTTWTNVGKLQFNIQTSTILSTVGLSLGDLLGGISPGLGKVGIFFDDFTSTYICAPGKVNSVATGLCGTSVIPRAEPETQLAKRTTEVLNDYETISIVGIPGVIDNAPLTFYNELTYAGFLAVHKVGTAALLQQIDGQQCAVAGNGSTITSVYLASSVASFKANYADFGCFLSTASGVSPAVSCTVQVTAYKTDGTEYADKAGCAYDGTGPIQQCIFPTAWTAVAKLSFSVVASQILTTIGPTLGSLVGGLLGTIGSVNFILDNFDANYNCVAGTTNSVVAPGLCG